jgi:uncharacterized protein YuzE
VRVSYDNEVDAAYIYLVREISGPVSTRCLDSDKLEGMINLDFDIDDRLVGIEVIPASKLLPREVLGVAS